MLANKADPAAIYSFSQSLVSILNSNYTMNYTNGILEHKLGSPRFFFWFENSKILYIKNDLFKNFALGSFLAHLTSTLAGGLCEDQKS